MTAWVIFSPSFASASAFSFCRIIAETSGGEYSLPPIATRTSPLAAALTVYGMCSIAFLTSASENLRPMKRLTEKIVFSGLVIAWRLATWPTSRSPVRGLTATTDGVSRPPSAFSSTLGSPASMTATTLLVVPRSIPRTFAIAPILLARSLAAGVEAELLEDPIESGDQCALFLRDGAGDRLVLGDVAPQAAHFLGHAERQADSGDVDAPLLAERLDLAQPRHVVARVEAQVAVC